MASWDTICSELWLGWFILWILAARSSYRNASNEPWASRLLHLIPLALAFGLLISEFPFSFDPMILPPLLKPWGVIQTAAGLLFSLWARAHLGLYWSGRIALKHEHRLIRSGPYLVARHPIYLGFLMAFSGSVLVQGKLSGITALLGVSAAYFRKIYREELTLHARFGKDYQDYCLKTGLLLPWP